MPRIAINSNALIEDLFTDFSLTARQREGAVSFFSIPRVKTECKEPKQVGHGLRLKNYRICTGFENSRIPCIECFANCFVRNVTRIEFAYVEMVTQEISRTRSIWCARCCCQTHQTS